MHHTVAQQIPALPDESSDCGSFIIVVIFCYSYSYNEYYVCIHASYIYIYRPLSLWMMILISLFLPL